MQKLITKEQFQTVLERERAVLMFSAPWCGDCVAIEPQIPEIELKFPEFTFYYVDRDTFIDECIEYDILGIPSFLVFHQGEEKGRFVSKFFKTKEEIIDFIEEVKGVIE